MNRIREDIRNTFQNSALTHSIDNRYRLETAHSTVARFKMPITRPEALIEQLRQYRNIPIGAFLVNELELVFNDWYQRAGKTTVLEGFVL